MMLPDGRPSLLKRIGVSVGLSIWFLLVYGASLAITAGRASVPSFYFGWETSIPFVAGTIIPYLSIDLFFVTAPLLTKSHHALRRYALRVSVAIAIAGLCFLLLPLRFAFDRPAVPGAIGFVFQQFQRADLPFNQFPSLHIALLLIVGDVFVRSTRGPLRIGLLIWFAVIAVSPALVFQHHVIDLVGGVALGLICLTLVDDRNHTPFERNTGIAVCYLAVTIVIGGACGWIGRASWPLWWVVLSFAVASLGYFVLGPRIYAKSDGRLSVASRLLLWPMMAGQVASHRWYARRARPYDQLTDRLWIGRWLNDREAIAARDAGVGAVIDLTCEFTEPALFRSLNYLHLPTLDLNAPTQAQLAEAVAFIQKHEMDTIVYVHCKAGYSRTAAIAAAYLLETGRASTVDDAIQQLRAVRPTMVVRSEVRRVLDRFSASISAQQESSISKFV